MVAKLVDSSDGEVHGWALSLSGDIAILSLFHDISSLLRCLRTQDEEHGLSTVSTLKSAPGVIANLRYLNIIALSRFFIALQRYLLNIADARYFVQT